MVVDLDEEKARILSSTIDIPTEANSSPNDRTNGHTHETNMTTNSPTNDTLSVALFDKLEHLETFTRELQEKNIRLETTHENFQQLLDAKEESLKSKDEVIDSLKTSMVILERSNKELSSKHLMIEATITKKIQEQKPTDAWYSVKRLLSLGIYK